MAKRKTSEKRVTRKTAKKTTRRKAAKKKTKKAVKKSIKKVINKRRTIEAGPRRGAGGLTARGLESNAVSFNEGDPIVVTGGLFNGFEGNVASNEPVAGGRIPVRIQLAGSCQPKNIEPENLAHGGSGPCG
jgi:hypothetical protein